MTLTEIANLLGTDRGDKHFEGHNYTPIYEKIFEKFRELPGNMLEIGINDPRFPGASLKMWREYFKNPQFNIYGYDIVDCSHFSRPESGVFTIQGDQSNVKDLLEKATFTNWDIILDDGSHFHAHQMASFNVLFKFLNTGGLYIIEDLHAHDGQKTRNVFKSITYDPLIKSIDFYNDGKLLVITRA